MACENGLLFFVQSLTCKPLLLPQTSNPPSLQELNELMEYSAKFDIRPRRRFLLTALFLDSFASSCLALPRRKSMVRTGKTFESLGFAARAF